MKIFVMVISFLSLLQDLQEIHQLVLCMLYFRPAESDISRFGLNWGAVWVKMASSWACVLIYMWTLFLPHCSMGRDHRGSGRKKVDEEEGLNAGGLEEIASRESVL